MIEIEENKECLHNVLFCLLDLLLRAKILHQLFPQRLPILGALWNPDTAQNFCTIGPKGKTRILELYMTLSVKFFGAANVYSGLVSLWPGMYVYFQLLKPGSHI